MVYESLGCMVFLNPLELEGTDQRWVYGSGPIPTKLAFVAEAPAMNEVREQRPLVGPSGEINWAFAARHGHVFREGAWVTNWRKLPITEEQKKKLTEEEVAIWDRHIQDELDVACPKDEADPPTVILLGAYATRAFLGEDYSSYWANGLPIYREGRVYIPVVHPAAGIHQPDMLPRTAMGYMGVRDYLEKATCDLVLRDWGKWADDPVVWLRQNFAGAFFYPVRYPNLAIDTEGLKDSPYCLTASTVEGQSYLVWAEDKQSIGSFKAELYCARPRLILHNAIHDAGVLRAMGINIWDFEVVDTMVWAYVLQDLPRDLKNLSRRLLNLNMEEYAKVVGPWAEKADREWQGRLRERVSRDLARVAQLTPKGKPRMSKGQPVVKLEGPDLSLTIYKKLDRGHKLSPHQQAWAEREIGPRPGLELKWVPQELAAKYAGKDSAATLGIATILESRIKDEGLAECADLDMSVLPLIEDMQECGLHLDIERYWEVLGEVSTRRREVIGEIQALVEGEGFRTKTGKPFNPGSGDQVADFCRFIYQRDRKLGLVKLTKTKTREATDSNSLSQVREEHPFIDLELEYRELDKYESTYLLPMKENIHEVSPQEWRVNFNLRATTVVSGRLSAHSPNVLAWPSRTKLGLRLRSVFTAPRGRTLVSWDLSQIELRLAAWASKDPVMMEAFLKGLDLHTNLASKLFGVKYEDVDKLTQRTPVKTIHYLLLYGGGGDKLFEELRGMGIRTFSREDCFRLIADTWKVYKGVATYMKGVAQEVRQKGYVSGLWSGRRRFLHGAQLAGEKWPVKGLRLEAERQAGNFKFQEGAAYLLKRSMRTVYREVYPEFKRRGIHFRLWLQVHDELLGEADEAYAKEVNEVMMKVMTQDAGLIAPVPLVAEGKMADSWGLLK